MLMKRLNLPTGDSPNATKIQQLINSVTEAISTGKLAPGNALPSVNDMSRQSGFSRDTVFKAYNILKKRSVIESTPTKGYFVASESFRVMMLLDDFSAFKEQLYRSFRENLPETYSVDLLFHHYNEGVFEQLVQNSLGRYSMYVVMNLNNRKLHPSLSKIDSNKLLVLDMGNGDRPETNFLLQNFDSALTNCLEEGWHLLQKYEEFVLIYSPHRTPHPEEIQLAFRQFCAKHGIACRVDREFDSSRLRERQAYLVVCESDLVQVWKACRHRDFSPGRQIGVIAYNDTPMKEIVGNGITVISTDFGEMGKKAAIFVKSKQKIREVLPTSLIIRESL